MTAIEAIPVRVEASPEPAVDHGNALPILHEIRHALGRLVADGESTCIDLNGIPFGPGDEGRLKDLLGTGEVTATIDALGPTTVVETAIPGVWLVDYRNSEGERLTLHIEITPCPEILSAQPEDLAIAIAALDARLDAGSAVRDPKS